MIRDRSRETAERRVTEDGARGRGARGRPTHFPAQGNLRSEQILHAAANVIGEAIAETQNSVGIKMLGSDARDDKWTQLRARREFVEQTELVQIQMGIVGQRHHIAGGHVMRAQASGLPIPHEFTKQVGNDGHAGIESPIERVVDGQVVDGGRIDGDAATESSAHKG